MKLTFNDFNDFNKILCKIGDIKDNNNKKIYLSNIIEYYGLHNYNIDIKDMIDELFDNKNSNNWSFEISIYYLKRKYNSEIKRRNFYFYFTIYNKQRLNRNLTLQFIYNPTYLNNQFVYISGSHKSKNLFYDMYGSKINEKYFIHIDNNLFKLLDYLIDKEFNINDSISNKYINILKLKNKKLNDNHYLINKNKRFNFKFNTYKLNDAFFDTFKNIYKFLIKEVFYFEYPTMLSSKNIVLPFKANIKRTNILDYSNKDKNGRNWNYKFQPLKNGYRPKQKEILFFNMLKEFDILIRK